MNPTHRVIITPAIISRWLIKVATAHRNPHGNFYELNMKQVKKARLLGKLCVPDKRIESAVFLISNASDMGPDDIGFDDLYLTILDREYMEQINTVRWKICIRDSYWRTWKYNAPGAKLHQQVYSLAHRQPAADNVHHKNFFTFDNRAANLEDVTSSAHRQAHATGPSIDDCFIVDSDNKLFDLVNSVL